jgi:hypothetical protein
VLTAQVRTGLGLCGSSRAWFLVTGEGCQTAVALPGQAELAKLEAKKKATALAIGAGVGGIALLLALAAGPFYAYRG